jgi:protoporphyrinogen oxidase
MKRAVIIGAGPAGLTAAYELLTRSSIKPVVLESSTYMGGLSRTVNYKGNRIDIGGHRFFSKSDRVMNWWLEHMPLSESARAGEVITYRNRTAEVPANAVVTSGDRVMLLRNRKSRIYFLRKFFEYPIQLSPQTLKNLGLLRTIKIGFSYLRVALFPPRHVENLEQFFISRFGRELYGTFFQSYTEKVWGVPCDRISAEWGAQRVKGLSITKTIAHFLRSLFKKSAKDVSQKETETSLIERFLYPKYGPGQMWEIVAEKVKTAGGEIVTGFSVDQIHIEGDRVVTISGTDGKGIRREFDGDYFFSTMPIKELVAGFDIAVPENIRQISDNLQYRDFITVGLLVKKLAVADTQDRSRLIQDNWIYIQEPDVSAGRLQIFNNWSPFLVAQPDLVWIGVEYFCYESDPMWSLPDVEMSKLAQAELEKIGIIQQTDVLDSTVIRMPKTYPAYFGAYERFDELREYLDRLENLFLVGRNGMHKYNNQDHSMLTAMTAVDNIIAGRTDKSNIWAVNTEMDYHEEKTPEQAEAAKPETRQQDAIVHTS